jgi:hypothetical protein
VRGLFLSLIYGGASMVADTDLNIGYRCHFAISG